MNTPRSPAPFPPVRLFPVADVHHRWSALLLEMPDAVGGDALMRLFGELGLYEAMDALPCIVTLSDPDDLTEELAGLLPADRIVLRIPASTCADPSRSGALDRLRATGFRLMTDGLPVDALPLHGPVTSVALPCPEGPVSSNIVAALPHFPGLRLALGVGTPDQHARCRDAGFDGFSGDYPFHPKKAEDVGNPHHQALLLQLLTLIAADADAHQLEAVFKHDAHLSYQLLKLVNSVAFSFSHKITSFSQAITLLGQRQLQRWLQLLLYAHAEGAPANPLMPRAALRAELMGALCAETGGNRECQDRAYMVGMFSLLDVLFGMAETEIVAPLNLADDVALALTERSGALGTLLRAVEAGEEGSGTRLPAALATAGIDTAAWAVALVQAYRWAIPISREA